MKRRQIGSDNGYPPFSFFTDKTSAGEGGADENLRIGICKYVCCGLYGRWHIC